MKDYTVYVDGISKVFAATGVRVGWTFGPSKLIGKIQSVISHMGAWAPKSEQTAVAVFLKNKTEVDNYVKDFKEKLYKRLKIFHNAFMELKKEGYNVDATEPQGALYLTVKLDFRGMKTPDGKELKTNADVYNYILCDARIAIVPFHAFGASKESPWYRISVGTCSIEDAEKAAEEFKKSIRKIESLIKV
jgi:aspartate aminotransferase